MKILKVLVCFVLFFVFLLINTGISPVAKSEEERSSLKERYLSLEQCIAYAIGNSFEIKLARLDFLIAQTGQGAAEAIFDTMLSSKIGYQSDKRKQLSVFGPQHTITNTYSIEATKKVPSGTELTLSFSDTRTNSDSGYVLSDPSHNSEAAIQLRQPLGKNFFGYIDRRNISVTSLAIENADLDTKERIEQLIADVEKAYWEWVFYKTKLQIYQEILEKAKELHQANTKNYDTGLIERGDLLASQANVLIREKDLLIAENQYKQAQAKIKLLINMEDAQRINPQDDLEYRKLQIALEDCLIEAFKRRRDYQQAKRETEIKNIVLETKANARWPEIDLVASMAANGISSKFSHAANKITSEDNTNYYAGLEISFPLENRLANSEYDKATHEKEKAIIELKKTERTIVTEIGNAFGDYITYEFNVVKLTEAAKLQKEKLTEEEKRFKFGRSNTKRLIDYQQDYLNAQLAMASGMLDFEAARVNLEKALNVVLERYTRLL